MKIAIVTEALGIHQSGGILCIIEVLNKLANKGHDVACFLRSPPYRSDWLKTNFPIYPISDMKKYDGVLVASYSPIAEEVSKAENAFDRLYWLHTLEHLFKWNGEEWSKRAYDSYSLPLKIFTTSSYIQIVLETMFNRNVIGQMVPPGVDTELFCRPEDKKYDRPFKVGVLWREDPVRGVKVAADGIAYAKLKGADIEMVPFGGIKDRRQMAQVMQQLDFYVDMSRVAGCPTPVLEAMACGVIPICTKYGTTDFVFDHWNGMIVPVDDRNELAYTLWHLADSDEGYLTALSQSAALNASRRSWDLVAAMFTRAITEGHTEGQHWLQPKKWD